MKKRKKVPLLGTFKEYAESKRKPAPQQPERPFTDVSMLAPLPATNVSAKDEPKKKKK